MSTNIYLENLLYKEKDKRTRNRKIWIQATEHNIIILSLSAYYTHEKGFSSSRSSSSSSANRSFTEFMIFLRNSLIFTLSGLFFVIPQTRNVFLIILGWFFKELMPSGIQLTISCLNVNQQFRLTISNTSKKWQISWKKNWAPSLRGTVESTISQLSFKGLSILFITSFCETRKINSNAIRVLFILLNFWKSWNWALN